MLEYLHHIPALIGSLLIAIGLALGGRRATQAAPGTPGSAAGSSGVSGQPGAPEGPQIAPDGLTARIAAELVGHEAIVCEAYKDSEGIWTWGIGVTDASGHKVERYIDHAQPIAYCLQVFVWLLRTRYLPDVIKAFPGHQLTEPQLAAALSFHYNTGAIHTASWVKLFLAGNIATARNSIMLYRNPASIIERREKERDLFFDGKWSGDGMATVYPVLKPSYQPDFHHPGRVEVLAPLQSLIA